MSQAHPEGVNERAPSDHDRARDIERAAYRALAHSPLIKNRPLVRRVTKVMRTKFYAEVGDRTGTHPPPPDETVPLPPASAALESLITSERLVAQFVDHCRQNAPLLPMLARYTERLHAFLGFLFVLSTALSRATMVCKEFLAALGIRGSRAGPKTPHHLLVVRAALAVMGSEKGESTEDDWANALLALELSGVPEDSNEAACWLAASVDHGGERVSGIRRARAVVAESRSAGDKTAQPKRAGRGPGRSVESKRLDMQMFGQILHAGSVQPVGIIEAAGDVPLPEGVWISLNNGSNVLRRVRLRPDQIRDLVVKSEGYR